MKNYMLDILHDNNVVMTVAITGENVEVFNRKRDKVIDAILNEEPTYGDMIKFLSARAPKAARDIDSIINKIKKNGGSKIVDNISIALVG